MMPRMYLAALVPPDDANPDELASPWLMLVVMMMFVIFYTMGYVLYSPSETQEINSNHSFLDEE